jgi:aryl-alcohol dehydrogenase-like predicted oxidoreductase
MSRLALNHYRLLGRSGLRVSPLALGTMTFGSDWGWGADAGEARRMFDLYVDRGGNFIDTAVNYTNGASEHILGGFLAQKREQVVLGTKFTMSRDPSNPNAGGNHRLNLVRSVEQSLRQLGTDRIDLLFLHAWDKTTSPEEVLRGLDDLVRSGKVVYLGISNTPAWRVSQLQTLADLRGWSPLVALQIEWSLVERTVEHELVPMARELGLGVLPWSPLGGGVLTGKYGRSDSKDEGGADVSPTRKGVIASSGHLTPQALELGARVRDIAAEHGVSPSQVAIAWLSRQPGVTSPILGARTAAQLEDNLGALDVELPPEAWRRLDEASHIAPIYPSRFIDRPMAQQLIFGQHPVAARGSV